MTNNPYKIDNFWEAYNSSRCKTAMLIISIIIIAGFAICEVLGNSNPTLYNCFVIIIGYWMGRTSKSKENQRRGYL